MRLLPNIITSLRILGSVAMVFTSVNRADFWIIYAFCGVSDMLDGFLARRFNVESETGKKLDSIADLAMVVACAWRLVPSTPLPSWIWWWTGAVAAVKFINIVSSLVVNHRISFPHTRSNRITGLLLFVMTPLIFWSGSPIPAAIVCSIATFAAVEEGHLIRTGREGC